MQSRSSYVKAIRLWKIDNERLQEIDRSRLDLEERLEEWLSSDISLISSNLLVIGRQVETGFGGYIDLLCMEENGDIVIIELKKDRTPREITAQVLDYASWVKGLTIDQVQEIAEKHHGSNLEDVYKARFNKELPESINQEHRMFVVGSEIDSSSQRIINYLSETYGVAMNAITFDYFRDEDREYLAQTFLIEPSRAELAQSARPSKRRWNLTYAQLQTIADERGVGEIYSLLERELGLLFNSKGTTRSSLAFSGLQDGKMNTIFSLIPGESSKEEGVMFRVYIERFTRFFNMREDQAEKVFPENKREWKFYESAPPEYSGYEGFFKTTDEIEHLLRALQ